MVLPFNFAGFPNIIFGAGKFNDLYNIIPKFGKNVLFVIGGNSLKKSGKWDEISSALVNKSINFSCISISGEPTPSLIDETSAKFRDKNINIVIGIGGGSVIDAGKAISAMLPQKNSIKNYLEGVGNKAYDGKKVPYVAVPTTSGTGSEATKNAVICEIGPNGFKKSLRHDNLVPNMAIIDPELVISCPSSISAACGLDAFTQLLEAYVSSKANPISDALAFSGMKYIKDNVIQACTTGALDINVRAGMAYGSLMSGITLANAGLGIVHGLASPIGAFFNIPHGVVCGTLLSEATKMNVKNLEKLGSAGKEGLKKHAEIGALISGKESVPEKKVQEYCSILIDTLERWTKELSIDRLGKFGIKVQDIDKIVKNSELKNNPVKLSEEDIKSIVKNRL